ncbi:MAG: leucine-rich repeat domain-containing protein [Lachnospiraceae bacterium]|nr:leucine-rich repeat domain-containing protein [Lachnospiraceae bacterium]
MNVNGYEIIDGILDLSKRELTSIDSKAFLSSKQIRQVMLPRSIERIGDWAFAKCSNLRAVKFAGPFRPGLFGRDVFAGCENLKLIEFADSDSVTARLHALCANKLPYDHLLRSDDVGQKSWYEKWDIVFQSVLASDDSEVRMSAALCGEEDISYDGIGSVDGELPGETGDYVQKEEFRKCSLCYIRLSNSTFLTESTENAIKNHLIANRFGEASGAAFYSIFEEDENILPYLRIYLDTVKPDRQMLSEMISAVPAKDVYARSFLIKEAGGTGGGADSLML